MTNATNRWLDRLAAQDKARGGTGSDYKLAQLLSVTPQLMYKYRSGVNDMGPDSALVLAQILKVHPMIVIGEIQAERARDARMQRLWADAARYYAKKAALAGAAILTAVSGPSLSEAAAQLCILCKAARERESTAAARDFGIFRLRAAFAGHASLARHGAPPFYRRRRARPTYIPGRIRHLSNLTAFDRARASL